MKKFTVPRATDLKTFTDQTYPQGSFAFAALLRAKDIRVNGVRTGKNMPLCAGDEVTYFTTPAQEARPSHAAVYEDDNVLICYKPDGVSFEGLAAELAREGEYYPVHRLDRNTQGLIVFAKTRAAEKQLLDAFKHHGVQKTYLALCKDRFSRPAACLTAYLKKDERAATVTISDAPRAGYVKIITEYSVLERCEGLALVKITLHTGRTHQIRAHMAHMGCPVLGDEKYGDAALNKKYGARRQRLVAKYLEFSLGGDLAYLSGRVFQSSFTPQK